MSGRPNSDGPAKRTLALLDGVFIGAGKAAAYQAVDVALPMLVSISAKPGSAVIAKLTGEADRNPLPLAGP